MTARWRWLAGLVLLQAGALNAAAPPLAGRDRYGDPLPRGAIARLSSSRWNVASDKPQERPARHLRVVNSLAFSADGRLLASGGEDGLVFVWDLETGRALHCFPGHHPSASGLAFSPDGKILATGDGYPRDGVDSREAQARLFDLRSGKLVRRFTAHLHAVNSLLFSPDAKTLATGGNDARVRLWDVATARRLGQVRFLPYSRPVAFLAGGKTLLIHQRSGPCLLIYTTTLATRARFGQDDQVYLSDAVLCRPGEKQVAVACSVYFYSRKKGPRESLRVIWHDLPSGKRSRSRELVGEFRARHYILSPDGAVVACVDSSGTIGLWDVGNGKQFATLTGHTSHPSALAFSPDSRLLASANYDKTVLLWDVERFWRRYQIGELLAGRGEAGALARLGERGMAALRAELLAAAQSERRAVRWIRDLDAEEFAVRERAERELEKMGLQAAFALGQVVDDSPSLEVRTRARRLLARLDSKQVEAAFGPAQARKVVAVLTKLGSPQARGVLKELARQGPDTLLGREARNGLERMNRAGSGR
jgi:hypothetical protein